MPSTLLGHPEGLPPSSLMQRNLIPLIVTSVRTPNKQKKAEEKGEAEWRSKRNKKYFSLQFAWELSSQLPSETWYWKEATLLFLIFVVLPLLHPNTAQAKLRHDFLLGPPSHPLTVSVRLDVSVHSFLFETPSSSHQLELFREAQFQAQQLYIAPLALTTVKAKSDLLCLYFKPAPPESSIWAHCTILHLVTLARNLGGTYPSTLILGAHIPFVLLFLILLS